MSAPKRQRLSLLQQRDIIHALDSGMSRSDIMAKYDLKHHSNLTKLLKRKEKILEEVGTGSQGNKKTIKASKYAQVDCELRDFVADMNTRGGAVQRSILKQQALDIAKRHGFPLEGPQAFKASDGYLDNFMKRKNIAISRNHGDAQNVDEAVVQDWKTRVPGLIAAYKPDDVFNCDELGLFFKLTPSHSYAIQGQSFKTGKRSKVRITVMLGANMTGTEKMSPLVIGKSEKPRCFKGIRRPPVMYRFNKKAWMTSALFEEYLSHWNGKLAADQRKVLLFIDNCSAHPKSLQLSNIQICFLPANTTSVLQPMDQGIIRCFKAFYRKRLVRHIVTQLELNSSLTIDQVAVDLLMAMGWVRAAWHDVTDITIRNCFRKSGFVNEDQEAEATTSSLGESFVPLGIDESGMNDFIDADADVCVSGSTHENRVADSPLLEMNQETEYEDEDVVLVKPAVADAIRALKTLETFFLFSAGDQKFSHQLDGMEHFVQRQRESMTQTKITDFFRSAELNE